MIERIQNIQEDGPHRIKDIEKTRIYSQMYREPSITRKTIIEQTGIRPTTVSKVVSELIDDGLVFEGDRTVTGGKGRPETALHPNPNRLVAISLCVLSHQIRGVIINLQEEILVDRFIDVDADSTNEDFIITLKEFTDRLRDDIPEDSELLGVGIAVPGSINRQTRTWIYNSRWPRLTNLSFGEFADITGLENHVTHFLNANLEYLMMKNPEYTSGGTVLYHWGFGIGASYAHDGKVLKSTLGSFAEVGHWQLGHGSDTACQCGARGCLETEAAIWALLPKLPVAAGKVPENEGQFQDYLLRNGLFEHPEILRARDRIEDSLVNLYQTFYPERILIYGPFVAESAFFATMARRMKERITRFYREFVRLERVVPSANCTPVGSTLQLFEKRLQSLLTAYW